MARVKRPNRKQLRKCCCTCFNPFPLSKLRRVGYDLFCPDHVPPPAPRRRPPKEAGPETLFYVLQCEPGTDSQVRAELLKQSKIHDLEKYVGKVFCPKQIVDGLVRPAGTVLADGTCDTMKGAVWAAEAAARHLFGPKADGEEVTGDELRAKYRFPVHQDDKSGKFVWKVRTKEELVRKVILAKKYPGYVICQLHWCHDVDNLVKKCARKGAWGLLLRPAVYLPYPIEVKESKRGGWLWKVRHPESGEIEVKGRAVSEYAGRQEAEAVRVRLEAFNPVALETEEAAELLVSQQAVNEIYRDKEELNRAIINYKEGDSVLITEGAFRGVTGTVSKITKKTPKDDDPEVQVNIDVWGNKVPVLVKFWEAKRV